MAYFTSITTRFGETYTSTDDNAVAFVGDHNGLSIVDNEIHFTSNSHIQWDGSVGTDADTDLIVFDRTFRFGVDDDTVDTFTRITGQDGANLGQHAYFVNCVFHFRGTNTSNSARRALLSYSRDDWDQARERAIPTSKSGNGTFNFYNCKFIYQMTGSSTNTGIVNGDMVDCTFINISPESGEFVFYPQPGSKVTGNSLDYTVFTSSSGVGGSIYQFDGAGPEEFEDNTIQNFYIYPVEPAGTFEAPFLSATQTNLYVSGFNADTNVAPENPPVIRNQDFSNSSTTFNNVAILTSPRTELRNNGNIYWRNARNSDNGSSFAPFDRPRVIASKRFERTVYTSPQQTDERELVKYHFKGNVNYTTAGTAHSIAVNSSDIVREYITDTDGKLTGTYNFIDGSSSADVEVKDKLDVPISYFKADATAAGTNNSDFYTSQFNFSTTLTAISLLGQTNYTTMYDSDMWADDQAAADAQDGYFITRDIVDEIDTADEFMSNYQDTETITGIAGATTDLKANDVYAIYKYGVWRQDESGNKFIGIEDFPYSDVGVDDVFGFVNNTVANLYLTSNASDAPYRVLNGTDLYVQARSLRVLDADPIKGLSLGDLNMGGGRILDGSIKADISNVNQFTSRPEDDDYSIRGTALDGTLEIDSSAANAVIVLDGTTTSGTFTITRSDTSNTATVYLVNGAEVPTVTDTGISVLQVKTVTLQGQNAADADGLAMRWASGSGDTPGTFADEQDSAINTIESGNNLTIEFEVPSSDTRLWYGIAYNDTNAYLVVDSQIGDNAYDTEATRSIVLTELTNGSQGLVPLTTTDFQLPGGAINLANTTVSAITSATDNISINLDDTDGTRSQMTEVITRDWLWTYVIKSDSYLDGIAQGFVPNDFITFNLAGAGFSIPGSRNSNRFSVSHTATLNYSYFVDSLISSQDDGDDLWRSATTDAPNTNVIFLPTTDGMSASTYLAFRDEQTRDIKGADDVDLTQAQADISTGSLGIPVTDR